MRILVVCTDLGVRLPDAKGASLHLEGIARALGEAGGEVLVAGVAGHGGPPDGMRTVLLPHPGRAEGLRREIRRLRFTETFPARVGDAVRDFGPDLVYERLSLFGTAGGRIARALGVPHVVEVNALLAEEEARWRGLRLTEVARERERRVLAEADLRVCVSREVAAAVDAVAPGRTIVVPNGVDAHLFAAPPSRAAARARWRLPAGVPLLGFAGALRPWHGLDTAVRALALVPEPVRLVVAGDGPVRADLETLAAGCGVTGRITWLGQVPHAEMPSVLAALDVALAPYPATADFAFSPLKLYEYLAAGVPVAASDIGQVREALRDGDLGTLVRPGDPAALAVACEDVLRHPEGARARARAARREALAEHAWTARARTILDAAGARAHALAG